MENHSEDEMSDEEVKSDSLIKFESSKLNFATLPAAVDLKTPPANWLNGQIKFIPAMSGSSVYNFSSFRMAFDFWHELGDVDVISDSENIKNLLKIPYSDKNGLSFFVHRIGNTLLIDDFDIHKYLLWKSEEDWRWLRSFIFENILSRFKGKPFSIKPKTREALEQKNLLSKFLYHSIEDCKRTEQKEYVPIHANQPLLPKLKREDISDKQGHQFTRNVLWTFEDIRMLIGSDMPIFGNQSRPCISLRLRDMKKPINVLTGIDYWLDNLMCNVPEIFLCFHQNGIVQKYEVIKTEDLPALEHSKFSPKVIRNVAQNILSFLKENATQPGHTYWLFKAKNDDLVKLYDLTTLQLLATTKEEGSTDAPDSDKKDDDNNPFTVPVAMLLYTVARNMKYSHEKLSAKKAGSIKELLNNCLKLLPKDKYPQIVTSSHYILSDIQIQAGTDPAKPEVTFAKDENDSDENSEEQLYEEQSSDEEIETKNGDDECSFSVQSIRDAMKTAKGEKSRMSSRPAPLSLGTVKERCAEALENIISGLSCLQYFDSESILRQEKQKEKEQIIDEEQNPRLANPDVPIPMGWSPSKEAPEGARRSKKKSRKSESQAGPSTSKADDVQVDSKTLLMKGAPNVKTWNTHLKVLLFEKASLAYACLAEDAYAERNFGKSLRYLKMSILCQNLVVKYVAGMQTQKSCLFGRAGDCFFQISKSLDNAQKFIDGFRNHETDLDKEILKELDKEELLNGEILPTPSDAEVEMMEASVQCYELSFDDRKESKTELVRRLGNVYNELGVSLMHRAQTLYNALVSCEDANFNAESQKLKEVSCKSYDNLMKAVSLFEGADDSINLIICNLNLGRFFRLSAHVNITSEMTPAQSLQVQKKYYQMSFSSYDKALAILETRKSNPELWDMVTWELSTSTFNLAKQMQDSAPADINTEESEREAIEMLQKALKLCDLDKENPRQVLYGFRAGLIHHRLAGYYHQLLRNTGDDTKKRTTLQICRLNYEKSANLFERLKEFIDYFQVTMERIALQEYLAEEAANVSQKMKNYQLALNHFKESYEMLKLILTPDGNPENEGIHKLMDLFEKRLQHVLKSLYKLAMSGKKVDAKAEVYKKMVACTLRSSKSLEARDLVTHLVQVLENLQRCEST